METVKLQKYFSDCAIMSRRAAETEIKNGKVTVNGSVAYLGLRIDPEHDVVIYKGRKIDGYDIVGTRRVTRKGEPPIRSFFARCFYKLINKMSKVEMVDGARDYVFMKRPVVDAIISLKEYNRYSKGIFSFVGFNTKWIDYTAPGRVAGVTKWSFWKLFKYALEGILAFFMEATFFAVMFLLLGICLWSVSVMIVNYSDEKEQQMKKAAKSK